MRFVLFLSSFKFLKKNLLFYFFITSLILLKNTQCDENYASDRGYRQPAVIEPVIVDDEIKPNISVEDVSDESRTDDEVNENANINSTVEVQYQ